MDKFGLCFNCLLNVRDECPHKDSYFRIVCGCSDFIEKKKEHDEIE